MNTGRTSYAVIAAVVSALVLAPWRGAAWPRDLGLQQIPVQGPLSPDGRFVGTLTIQAVTVAEAGQLLLTGVLHGTATRRTGATTPVRRQTFTVPAVPIDAAQTTDVVLLKMAPIALASVGRQLTLAPIPLDIEAVPEASPPLPTLLN
jgi:hypothetical protein